jgi:hypothetical protein
MVTIHRAQGLRVVIFTDDHEPAHVHVFGDGHAKINLIGPDGGAGTGLGRGHEAQRAAPCDADRDRGTRRLSGAMERDTWLT